MTTHADVEHRKDAAAAPPLVRLQLLFLGGYLEWVKYILIHLLACSPAHVSFYKRLQCLVDTPEADVRRNDIVRTTIGRRFEPVKKTGMSASNNSRALRLRCCLNGFKEQRFLTFENGPQIKEHFAVL